MRVTLLDRPFGAIRMNEPSVPASIFTESPGFTLIFDPGAISPQTCPLSSVITSSPRGLGLIAVAVAESSVRSSFFSSLRSTRSPNRSSGDGVPAWDGCAAAAAAAAALGATVGATGAADAAVGDTGADVAVGDTGAVVAVGDTGAVAAGGRGSRSPAARASKHASRR